MARLPTKFFGEIDLERPEEWYEAEHEINGETVEVSMTFSTTCKILGKDDIERVDNFIENLRSNVEAIRLLLQQDFESEGETRNYIDSQIEEQDKDDIADLIKDADKKLSKKEKLLSVLTLLRIVFYPEKGDKMFAVLDYTIDGDLTDDLLVVKLYKDNNVTIDIES